MRRIVLGAFQSLDGVMQAPGGPDEDPSDGFVHGGWGVPHFDDAVMAFMGDRFAAPFDLLLGRRTYDIFAAHWPHAADDPFADRINACRKYVVTHRPDDLGWRNVHPLPGVDAVAALRDGDGPDLIVQGSTTLHAPLLSAGLVDALFLLTFPVLLGSGRRAFDGVGAGRWRVTEHRTSPGGVAMLCAVPDGAVATGSFAIAP